MAGPHASDKLEFAGDYNLSNIFIIGYDGKPVDIKKMVQELNIYEGIYKNAITGSVVITDAQNLISKMPLQGTERIAFKLSTPGAKGEDAIDMSEESGHPMYIYKLTNRKQISEGILLYTLHFCSREMFRNIRTRVSQAYTGPLHQSVVKIFKDEAYLDSKKILTVEETRNNDTIVVPNMRPLKAIDMIADKALPSNTKGAGYLFYETTKGFHFRSFENLLTDNGAKPREPKHAFDYMVQNVPVEAKDKEEKVIKNLQSVEKYEFINNYDSAAQQALGTYAQNVITHNIYDKTFTVTPFNYHKKFEKLYHTDSTGIGQDRLRYPIVDLPVDFDEKGVSEYPNSVISLEGTTQYLHGKDTGAFGIDQALDGDTYATRNAQENAILAGTRLKLTTKGISWLQAGDVIWFSMRSIEPNKEKKPGGTLDDKFAGRYIITKLRHRVIKTDYKCVIECVKDGVMRHYETGAYKKFPGKTNKKAQIRTLRGGFSGPHG